jgi:hypothetical protein
MHDRVEQRPPIVHFVGSIPLPDTEMVFRTLSAAAGPHLKLLASGMLIRPSTTSTGVVAISTTMDTATPKSAEGDPEKRKALVWQIEKILAENGARPIIFFDRRTTCW